MGDLNIGPGVNAWIVDHQATPLSDECYLSPGFLESVTAIALADASGRTIERHLHYYKLSNELILGDPDRPLDPRPAPPAGPVAGFDIGFPQSAEQLLGVAKVMGRPFAAPYVGGPDYGGTWTPAMALALKGLVAGYAPLYVGDQAGMALDHQTGYSHGRDAVQCAVRFGFGPCIIWLDVEAGTPGGLYAQGWIQAVHDAGYRAGVYGSDVFLAQLPAGTGKWLAGWDGRADPEDYDIHQYINDQWVAGAQVDLNMARAGLDLAQL